MTDDDFLWNKYFETEPERPDQDYYEEEKNRLRYYNRKLKPNQNENSKNHILPDQLSTAND